MRIGLKTRQNLHMFETTTPFSKQASLEALDLKDILLNPTGPYAGYGILNSDFINT